MNEELDPKLRRWFAAADTSLTDADFVARAGMNRRRRRAIDGAGRIGLAVWGSLAKTLVGPLRLSPGLAGLAGVVAVAIALGLAAQS
jgi:hypothetical protein